MDVSRDEVARVASPDGRLDAILIETNGGATTPFGYEVYVGAHGAAATGDPALNLTAAVRNDTGASGANLRWQDARTLRVEFESARAQSVASASVTIDGERVTIQAHSGIVDASAPAGGMLYNLKHARSGG